MPDYTLRARKIVDELNRRGVTHLMYLPESGTRSIYDIVLTEGRMTIVPVCREGEAFAIAAGLIAGGKQPVVLIQNTGFFESGDSIRGVVLGIKLPLLFLVGYRGWKKDLALTDSAAIYLEPILKAWGIPYYLVETVEDAKKVSLAYREAQERYGPVAVLITPEAED